MFFLAFFITCVIIDFIAVLLNAFGFCILMTTDFRQSNPMIFIKNLSIVNLILALAWLFIDTFGLLGIFTAFTLTLFRILRGTAATWFFLMFSLTLDRFFGINFPIQYKVTLKRKHYRLLATVLWITGIIIAIILQFQPHLSVIYDITFLALDGIFLILFTVTYSTAYYRLKIRRPMKNQSNGDRDNSKIVRMITIMLLAFLLFEVIPQMVIVDLENKEISLNFLYRCNVIFHPIIYVLMNPKARNTLSNFCTSTKRVLMQRSQRQNGGRNEAEPGRNEAEPGRNEAEPRQACAAVSAAREIQAFKAGTATVTTTDDPNRKNIQISNKGKKQESVL